MNSRERLLTTLRGQMADRVPVAPFVQEEYLSFYYPSKSSVDRVVDATRLAEELDFDLMAKPRTLEMPHFFRRSYANWELRRAEAREGKMIRRRLEIVTPARTLSQDELGPESGASTTGVRFMAVSPLLKDADDVEAFLKYLPRLDDKDRVWMNETAAGWSCVLGERGVLAPWGFAGVFNFAADLCGLDNFYVMPYEDEARYNALMEGVSTAMCDYTAALAESSVDCIGIQGHMAGGSTTGSEFFRQYVQPHEHRVIEGIHAAGKFSVYHNCGCAKSLYSNYRELGMTVWETVSEPPRGDNLLADAKAALGDRICLLGNLDQVDFLKRATPAEVSSKTREIVLEGKSGGRFIFSTSDYLETNTPIVNVVAMIGAAKEAGRYT
jgi:uroporphyrinogen-III decarboxylase